MKNISFNYRLYVDKKIQFLFGLVSGKQNQFVLGINVMFPLF